MNSKFDWIYEDLEVAAAEPESEPQGWFASVLAPVKEAERQVREEERRDLAAALYADMKRRAQQTMPTRLRPDPAPAPEEPIPRAAPEELMRMLQVPDDLENAFGLEADLLYTPGPEPKKALRIFEEGQIDEIERALEKRGLKLNRRTLGDYHQRREAAEALLESTYGAAWDTVGPPELNKRIMATALLKVALENSTLTDPEEVTWVRAEAVRELVTKYGLDPNKIEPDNIRSLAERAALYIADPSTFRQYKADAQSLTYLLGFEQQAKTGDFKPIDEKLIVEFNRQLGIVTTRRMRQAKLEHLGVTASPEAFDQTGDFDWRLLPLFKQSRNKYEILLRSRAPIGSPKAFFRYIAGREFDARATGNLTDVLNLLKEIGGREPSPVTIQFLQRLTPEQRRTALHIAFSSSSLDEYTRHSQFGVSRELVEAWRSTAGSGTPFAEYFEETTPAQRIRKWTRSYVERQMQDYPRRVEEANRLLGDGGYISKEELTAALDETIATERQAWLKALFRDDDVRVELENAKARVLQSNTLPALALRAVSFAWEQLGSLVKKIGGKRLQPILERPLDPFFAWLGKQLLAARATAERPDLVAQITGIAPAKEEIPPPLEVGRTFLFGTGNEDRWQYLADLVDRKNLGLLDRIWLNLGVLSAIARDMPADIAQAVLDDPVTAIGAGPLALKGLKIIRLGRVGKYTVRDLLKKVPISERARRLVFKAYQVPRAAAAAAEMALNPFSIPSVLRSVFSADPTFAVAYGISAQRLRRTLNRMPEEVRQVEFKKWRAHLKLIERSGLAKTDKIDYLTGLLSDMEARLERGLRVGLPDAERYMEAALENLGPELAQLAVVPERTFSGIPYLNKLLPARPRKPFLIAEAAKRRALTETELAEWLRAAEEGKAPTTVTRLVMEAQQLWLDTDASTFTRLYRDYVRPMLERQRSSEKGSKMAEYWINVLDRWSSPERVTQHLAYIEQGELAFEAYRQHKEELLQWERFVRASRKRAWRMADAETQLESGYRAAASLATRRYRDALQKYNRIGLNDPDFQAWAKNHKRYGWAYKTWRQMRRIKAVYRKPNVRWRRAATALEQALNSYRRLRRKEVVAARQKMIKEVGEFREFLRNRENFQWRSLYEELSIDLARLEIAKRASIADKPPHNVQPIEEGFTTRLSPGNRKRLLRLAVRDHVAGGGAADWIPDQWRQKIVEAVDWLADQGDQHAIDYRKGWLKPESFEPLVNKVMQRVYGRFGWGVSALDELFARAVRQFRQHMEMLYQAAKEDAASFITADLLLLPRNPTGRRLLMAIQNQASHFLAEPHRKRLEDALVELAEWGPEGRAVLHEWLSTGERPKGGVTAAVERMYEMLETERHAFIEALEETGIIDKGFGEKMRRSVWQAIFDTLSSEDVRQFMPARPGVSKFAPPLLNWPRFDHLKVQRTPGVVRVLWHDPRTGKVQEKRFNVPGEGEARYEPKNISKAMREANAWIREQIKHGKLRRSDIIEGGPIKPPSSQQMALRGAKLGDLELQVQALRSMWSDLVRNKIYYVWGLQNGWVKPPSRAGVRAGPPGVPIDRHGEWIYIEPNKSFGPLSGMWVRKKLIRELNAWDEGWRVLEAKMEQFREDVLESPLVTKITQVFYRGGSRHLQRFTKFLYRNLITRNLATWATNHLTNMYTAAALGARPYSLGWNKNFKLFADILEAYENGVKLESLIGKNGITELHVRVFKRGMLTGLLSPTVAAPTSAMFGSGLMRRWRQHKEWRQLIEKQQRYEMRRVEHAIELLEGAESKLINEILAKEERGQSTTQLQRRLAETQEALRRARTKLEKVRNPLLNKIFPKPLIRDFFGRFYSEKSVIHSFLDREYSLLDARAKFATMVELTKQHGIEQAQTMVGLFMQQYGMVSPFIRRLRVLPVAGSFVPSFTHEALRILKNVATLHPRIALRMAGMNFAWNTFTLSMTNWTYQDFKAAVRARNELDALFQYVTSIIIPTPWGLHVISLRKYMLLDVFAQPGGLMRPMLENMKSGGEVGWLIGSALTPVSQLLFSHPAADWIVRRFTGVDPWRQEEITYRGAGLGQLAASAFKDTLSLALPRTVTSVWEQIEDAQRPPSPYTQHQRTILERILSTAVGIGVRHATPKTIGARLAMEMLRPEDAGELIKEMQDPVMDLLRRRAWSAREALKEGDIDEFRRRVRKAAAELKEAGRKHVYIGGVWLTLERTEEEWAEKLVDYVGRTPYTLYDKVPIDMLPNLITAFENQPMLDPQHKEYVWSRLLDPNRLTHQSNVYKLARAASKLARLYSTSKDTRLRLRFGVAFLNVWNRLIRATLLEAQRETDIKFVERFLKSPRGNRLKLLAEHIMKRSE